MTMLNELQKAIDQLEAHKDELLKNIQAAGWQDDRHENKKIPQRTTIDDLDLVLGVVPEKRLLSPNIGRLYQHWYRK